MVRGCRLLVAWLAHAGYRHWALPAATWVAVQNREQGDACEALGLRNVVLHNILLAPPEELAAVVPDRDVIWAGNVLEGRRSKGLGELAELARCLPDVSFTVAGETGGGVASARRSISCAACRMCVSPVRWRTRRRSAQMAGHRLVVNTSPSEGFSNVMLEGWALGRPCVTLAVNPSGLLTGDRLGICAGGDLTTMAAAVVALLAEPAARSAMGERGREYVSETHAPERVCAAFERLVAS